MPRFEAGGNASELGLGYSLLAPGMKGVYTIHTPREGKPGPGRPTASLLRGFRLTNVEEQHTIELRVDPEGELREAHPERTLTLEVADLKPDYGYLLLTADEAGVLLWLLPENQAGPVPNPEHPERLRFRLPRYLPNPAEDLQKRYVFGKRGCKLLKILRYPLQDPLYGDLSDVHALQWESHNNPTKLLRLEGSGKRHRYRSFAAQDWDKVAGKVLLFLHGTFSSTKGAFGDLPDATLDHLQSKYPGGVFAFDHSTVSVDPFDNAWDLRWHFPRGKELEIDILCHSRGGLVARSFEALAQYLFPEWTLRVNKILFVATPNAGTPIASIGGLTTMVSALSSFINLWPSTKVPEKQWAQIVLTLKLAQQGNGWAIRGVLSMDPDGCFLQGFLTMPSVAESYTIGSDFNHWVLSVLRWIGNPYRPGHIFGSDPNDAVVPQSSVSSGVSPDLIKVKAQLNFPRSENVHHLNYFTKKAVSDFITTWLS